MRCWDIEMRHIVDVDGQLLAVDPEVIDTRWLLAKANLPVDRCVWQVRAGERFLLQPRQLVRLSEDEVLFFETSPSAASQLPQQLAA